MRRSTWGSILATLLVLGGLGVGGYSVYQAGYRAGLMETASEVIIPGGYAFFPGFGLFFGFIFLFFLFGIIGRIFFWGRWRRGPYGRGWHDGEESPMEKRLADWHEKAHDEGRRYRSGGDETI